MTSDIAYGEEHDHMASFNSHTSAANSAHSDSNEYDPATVRAYAGRSQVQEYLRRTGWKTPLIAYLVLLIILLLML